MDRTLLRTVIVYGVLGALLLGASLVVEGPGGLALRAAGALLAGVALVTAVWYRIRER